MISAWRRETVASSSWMSAEPLRPIRVQPSSSDTTTGSPSYSKATYWSPGSSCFRTESSHVGRAAAGEIASASTVGDSNIEARRKREPPQAGQRGSSSKTESEIEYPHSTQTREPSSASSPVSWTSVPSSTSNPTPRHEFPYWELGLILTGYPRSSRLSTPKGPQFGRSVANLVIES